MVINIKFEVAKTYIIASVDIVVGIWMETTEEGSRYQDPRGLVTPVSIQQFVESIS